jgi:capsular exopolysaccharide synthesis family protein
MELKEYLQVLSRRGWVVVLTTLTTLATVVVGSIFVPPTYSTTATLRATTTLTSTNQFADFQYSERFLNTIPVLATSGPTLAELAKRLGLPAPPLVTAELLANTEIIRVTVVDRDPALTQKAANTLLAILMESARKLFLGESGNSEELLKEQVSQVENELKQIRQQYSTLVSAQDLAFARRDVELKEQAYAALLDQYQKARTEAALQTSALSVVDPATLPLKPSKPRIELNVVVGLLLGLVGGVGLAFLSEHLDTTLYAHDQVAALAQSPLLAVIPTAKRQHQPTMYDGHSPQGLAFRRLRTVLLRQADNAEPKNILVTSAEPKEGKSTVVANLGYSLAQLGRKVVVVDCDLRSPTLHRIFDLSNAKGLSGVLKPDMSLEETLQETKIPGLYALTSGPVPVDDPSAALGSKRFATMVTQLAKRFDFVLLDGPALSSASEVSELAAAAHGVLLVIRLGQTEREAIQKARQELIESKANVIGVVVNRAGRDGGALL